jgi:hypothetical protein
MQAATERRDGTFQSQITGPKVPLNIMWRQANYRAAAAAIHKGEEAGKGMGGTLLY